MNKFTKISLITALILILTGLVAVTIGICLGGIPKVVSMAENGELTIHTSYDGDLNVINFNDSIVFNNNYDIYTGDYENSEVAVKTDVQNLDVELGGGQLIIETSSDDNFQVSSNNAGKFQCYVENGVLYIKGMKSVVTTGSQKNIIYLSVPSGIEFESTYLELGGGTIEIDSMEVADLEVQLGAGTFEISDLKSNELNIEIGAGSAIVENGDVKDVTIEVGMGEMIYDGRITGDLDADCSMGSIEMTLDGNENDHNYYIDCAMGEVSVGNSSYAGMATERNIDNDADSDFNITCSMGSINIIF